MTNLAISSLFFFHLFWCLLSGKPKKDCSLDLEPLTLQAFMDKDQWVWMSKVMLQWGVYLLIVFCFLKHSVVCVFLVWEKLEKQNNPRLWCSISSGRAAALSWQKRQFCTSRYEKRTWTLTPRTCCKACLYSSLSGRGAEGRGEIWAKKVQRWPHSMWEEPAWT